MVHTANQPIMFGSDGIVRYGEGVADTYQEKTIVDVENTPKNFTNSQGTVQYVQYGTGSSGLQPFATN